MAVVYDSGDYHSVADSADFTLPNGDWAWLVIVRPDQNTGGQDILSTGEWGTSGTYNFYQFDTDFGFKYEGTTERLVTTVSAGNWVLLVAQRSGGNLTLRSVPMGGSTVTNSGSITVSNSVNPSSSLMMGRRSDTGDNPFIGAGSDFMLVPGETISDADMQSIATGTAIDSFSWYSSRVFWNIADTSTQSDQTGNHTVTANGTLVSATDPTDLVRFGGAVLSADGVGGFSGVAGTKFKGDLSAAGAGGASLVAGKIFKAELSAPGSSGFTANSNAKYKADLSADGVGAASFDALTGEASLSADGVGAADFDGAVTGKGDLSAAGTGAASIEAKTIVKAVLSASGAGGFSAASKSTASSELTADGVGAASFTSETDQAILSADGVGGADFDIESSAESAYSMAGTGGFTVHATARKLIELSAAGAGGFSANSTAENSGDLSASGVGGFSGVASVIARSVLTAEGTGDFNAIPEVSTLSDLSADGVGGFSADVRMDSEGVFSASGAGGATFNVRTLTVPVTRPDSNLYIIPENFIDNPDTLTATSTASGFDIDNTKLDTKSKIWRSTATTAQTITATWSSAKFISAVGLAFTNLVAGSTVQIKLYTNSGDSSAAYDTGSLSIEFAYDPPTGFSSIGLNSFAYGGGNYFSKLFATVSAEKIEIIVTSSGNPDGYIEISRIICGTAYTPTIGASYGAQVTYDDNTSLVVTDSGDTLSNRGIVKKSISFSLDHLNTVSKHGITNVIKNRGSNSPVFMSLYENSENPEERTAYMIYGRINSALSAAITRKNFYSSSVSITEV